MADSSPADPEEPNGQAKSSDAPARPRDTPLPPEGAEALPPPVEEPKYFTIRERDEFVARMRQKRCNVELDEEGDVLSLIMGFTKIGDEDLEHLDKLPKLEYLALDHTNVTDRGLEHLAGLKSLKALFVGHNSLSPAGIRHLAGLENLEHLDLTDLPIGDDVLRSLAGLKRLKRLNLDGTRVTLEGTVQFAKELPELEVSAPTARVIGGTRLTMHPGVDDAGLARLKTLPTLRELDLWECSNVTDAGMEHVRELSQLTGLELGYTQVTDAGLAELRALENLEKLDVRQTDATLGATLDLVAALPKLHVLADWGTVEGAEKLTFQPAVEDEQLGELRRLPGIKELNLWRCDKLTDAAMTEVVKLSQLRTLNLGATNIGDDALAALGELPQLERLVLANTRVTDQGLARLVDSKGLVDLDVSSTGISDDGLKTLGAMRQLQSLSLAATAVTDAGLAHLVPLKNLKSLDLGQTAVTGDFFEKIAPELPNLQSLDLSLTLVGDTALARAADFKSLEHLDLAGTRVTDGGVKHLERSGLTRLGLFGTAVSDEAVAALKEELPRLAVLYAIEP